MYRIPPEKIFSSFFSSFFLSFYLYLFIYSTVSLFTLYYPLFVSLVRLDSSSFTLFIFIFIRFYFRSFLRAPHFFHESLLFRILLFVYSSPAPLPLKKIREKKNASLFIALTDRTFAKSSRYHVKFLSPRSFNAHPRREFPQRSSSDFFFIYLIFLLYFQYPSPLELCCTARRERCTHAHTTNSQQRTRRNIV